MSGYDHFFFFVVAIRLAAVNLLRDIHTLFFLTRSSIAVRSLITGFLVIESRCVIK